MNPPQPTATRSEPSSAEERRAFLRYPLPVPLTVESRGARRVQLLERVPVVKNISAGGVYFSLCASDNASLTEGSELGISFPLVESAFHPARVYAHCRARVVRRDGEHGVAAHFEQVAIVREERASGLPVPLSS